MYVDVDMLYEAIVEWQETKKRWLKLAEEYHAN